MAARVLMLIVAAAWLTSTNLAIAGGEPEFFHVGGKVLCQDCNQGYNEWIHGSKPIKGSKVSITCMDKRHRVIHYGSDETDEQGEYDITISKYKNGKEVKPELCTVRLVSSPDPVCNIFTNFGSGKSGVKLQRPSSVFRDLVKYTLGPFYCTLPMCEKPDTSENQEGEGSN
ncbi:pistil-specific extensin-like protein [Tripterygium wilfordii]|uniref:Pistil-specific extensin-like protein n=1 Tax=Tripterygium wilfordii TaxID=458696 RepID=A0A7J7DNA6_TRIWF|nr:pistil-specific extensin-like protein [Tripterygium wilfordii]KAF5747852.1 pistil-specific extensin-like protein [Tripterygium wilfordii]